MNKIYTIGDIHGRIEALREVLGLSKFDYEEDTLILLGDVVDGGYNTYEVVEELLKIKHLVFVVGNHDCLTPEVELLTRRGWLHYNQIIDTDEIFSLDTSTNKGKWDKINNIIIKDFEGELVSLNGNRLSIDMTPTHRVLAKQRSVKLKGFKEYEYILAKDLAGRIKIPLCTKTEYSDYNFVSDDEIRFTAWVLTDGCIQSLKRSKSYAIYQSKDISEIIELIKRLGYTHTISERQRDITTVCGKTLKKPPLTEKRIGINGKSNICISRYIQSKKLPEWIKELSERQFNIFLRELIKGDGSTYPNRSTELFILYGKEQFLSELQSVCVTKGWPTTLSYDNRGSTRLNICTRDTFEFDSYLFKKNKNYKGKVWCLNVPLSNFLIRKNGKPSFTGNCWFMNHIHSGWAEDIWLGQGGRNTLKSYNPHFPLSKEHQEFFSKAVPYHVQDNMLFVHGGFDARHGKTIDQCSLEFLTWDRDLIEYAREGNTIPGYEWIFVGHTTTQKYSDNLEPIRFGQVWCLDTGAGWSGVLSLLDCTNKDFKKWEIYRSKIQEPAVRG